MNNKILYRYEEHKEFAQEYERFLFQLGYDTTIPMHQIKQSSVFKFYVFDKINEKFGLSRTQDMVMRGKLDVINYFCDTFDFEKNDISDSAIENMFDKMIDIFI